MTQPPEAGDLRAVAWLYERPNYTYPDLPNHQIIAHERWPDGDPDRAKWSETPLYKALSPAPSQGDVERVARALHKWVQENEQPDTILTFGECRDSALRMGKAAIAAMPVSAVLDPDGYLWKWVERGLFDPHHGAKTALEVLAYHPDAPWNQGRWDVDHKSYAKQFYERFPKAALSDDDGKEGRK